jgi:hypothetical protein
MSWAGRANERGIVNAYRDVFLTPRIVSCSGVRFRPFVPVAQLDNASASGITTVSAIAFLDPFFAVSSETAMQFWVGLDRPTNCRDGSLSRRKK